MTELDDVLAERFKSGNSVPVERVHITADEFAQFKAALEDARRYRFLRDKCNHNRVGWHVQFSTQDRSFDAAIDAAQEVE